MKSSVSINNNGVSIIIVTRNSSQELDLLISSFLSNNTHYPFELIIVDLVSVDDTAMIINKYNSLAYIKHLKCKRNLSMAAANNLGAQTAAYHNLLFMSIGINYNADNLTLALEKLNNNQFGAVGINWPDASEALKVLSIAGSFVSQSVKHSHSKELEDIDKSYYLAVGGAVILCKKTDYADLGVFCKQYGYSFENEGFQLLLVFKSKKELFTIKSASLDFLEAAHKKAKESQRKKKNKHSSEGLFKDRMGDKASALMLHSKNAKDSVKTTYRGATRAKVELLSDLQKSPAYNGAKEICLFVPYFKHPTAERCREIDEAFVKNHQNKYISKIIALIDDQCNPPICDDKVTIVNLKERPTYRSWLKHAKMIAPNSIAIFANADIYFDDSIRDINRVLNNPCSLIALSRHEKFNNEIVPHPNPQWSQDAWALDTVNSVPEALSEKLNIPVGVPRCDNKLAYCFSIYGWHLYNPYRLIKCYHLHQTQIRNYDKQKDTTLLGGVAYVYPTSNLDEESVVDYSIWSLGSNAVNKVKLDISLRTWLNEQECLSVSTGSDTNYVLGITPPGSNALSSEANNHLIDKFIHQGILKHSHNNQYSIYNYKNQYLLYDKLFPELAKIVPESKVAHIVNCKDNNFIILSLFIPPVAEIIPQVNEFEISSDDYHFWQYPAATEKQAYDNHSVFKYGQNIDLQEKKIHLYIGLPWATYIDKNNVCEEALRNTTETIQRMRALAESLDIELRVHTVCQHIHWQRMIDHFANLGVTDLHLSHCENKLMAGINGYNFAIHSWPLYAVNIENHERSNGIYIGKPLKQKKYLASFRGNHMGHYRNNIREKLFEVFKCHDRDDVLFELGDEWHFNKLVYKKQVKNIELSHSEKHSYINDCTLYNQILSDSVFSLCPEGAGPNTLRFWESLAIGSIPVVLSDDWVLPQTPGGPQLIDSIVQVKSSEVKHTYNILKGIKPSVIEKMQKSCMSTYQSFKSKTCWNPLSLEISSDYFVQQHEGTIEGGLKTKGLLKKTTVDKPLVTVVTTVLNGADHLEQAIQSVLNQSYQNIEYIIVDGGSNDGTLNIIEKYNKDLDYYMSEPDLGIYDGINKGVKLASGDYIIILNSDDYYDLNAIEKLVEKAKNIGADIIAGHAVFLNDDETFSKRVKSKWGAGVYIKSLLRHEAMLVSSKTYKQIGLYDSTKKIISDRLWMIRAYENNMLVEICDYDVLFFRQTGISSNIANKEHHIEEKVDYLKTLEPTLRHEDFIKLAEPWELKANEIENYIQKCYSEKLKKALKQQLEQTRLY